LEFCELSFAVISTTPGAALAYSPLTSPLEVEALELPLAAAGWTTTPFDELPLLELSRLPVAANTAPVTPPPRMAAVTSITAVGRPAPRRRR
jgi:hypothetical protein